MAKTVYVKSIGGSDSNDGSSWALAKATILGARAVTVAYDLVLIAPGVYPEANAYWSSANDASVLYRKAPGMMGKVIVDFENRAGTQLANNGASNWRMNQPLRFLDIHFRNPYPNSAHSMISSEGSAHFVHCVFYDRDGPGQQGSGITTVSQGWQGIYATNCTFYNLYYGQTFGTVGAPAGGNYFIDCVDAIYGPGTSGTPDYNAYPGNTEVNGINTSVGANPGVVDLSGEDFRVDPDTTPADYVTFMSAGRDGGRIGAFGGGGLYFAPGWTQNRYLVQAPTAAQGNPQPVWENEGPNGTNTYTAGTPGDIIENVSTFEPEVDLVTTPLATGGRMRSDVFDTGTEGANRFESVSVEAFEDLPGGAAVDIDDTLPQQIEYRSSDTLFTKDAGSPSWTAAAKGSHFDQAHRYHQLRITLRTQHTNA